MVLPVRERAELLEVHPVNPGRHRLRRLRLGVLLEHPFVALHVHLDDLVIGAERVQFWPMVEVLERIVRAVVRAPAYEDEQVPPVVEILLKELAGGRHVLGQQLTLHLGPLRSRHR